MAEGDRDSAGCRLRRDRVDEQELELAWTSGAQRLRRRLVVAPVSDERLPTRLCRHLVELLPVTGAGICVLFAPDVSVPVGVSDAAVMEAEAWQFSRGQGPCWQVYATGEVVVSGDLTDPTGRAARTWPTLCAPIIAHTDFRQVISVPLFVHPTVAMSVNLYSPCAPHVPEVVVRAALDAAGEVSAHLRGHSASRPPGRPPGDRTGGWGAGAPQAPDQPPAWLDSPVAAGRHQVWLAEGMLMHHADISATPALALLRAYAFAHDRTVDAVADDLTHHSLSPADILGA